MKIYQVVHREPYEPGWVYGTFLNKDVAVKYANALVRCNNCPLNYCQSDEELDEAIRNIHEYCTFYNAPNDRGCCTNHNADDERYIALETMDIIEDEIFDYNAIHKKMRGERYDHKNT